MRCGHCASPPAIYSGKHRHQLSCYFGVLIVSGHPPGIGGVMLPNRNKVLGRFAVTDQLGGVLVNDFILGIPLTNPIHCLKVHCCEDAPTKPDLDEYDCTQGGYRTISTFSCKRISGRNSIANLPHLVRQDSQTDGGEVIRNCSDDIVVAGVQCVLSHEVQVWRAIYDDPIVPVFNITDHPLQKSPVSQKLARVPLKGLRRRECSNNLAITYVLTKKFNITRDEVETGQSVSANHNDVMPYEPSNIKRLPLQIPTV